MEIIKIKVQILGLVFLFSGMVYLSGCVEAYVGGVLGEHHREVQSRQECLEKGGTWIGGSSWVFTSGKCEFGKTGKEKK